MKNTSLPISNANRYMAFEINNEWHWSFANVSSSHSDIHSQMCETNPNRITQKFGGFYCKADLNASDSSYRALLREDTGDEYLNIHSKPVIMLFGVSDSFPMWDREGFEKAIESLKISTDEYKIIVIDDFDTLN